MKFRTWLMLSLLGLSGASAAQEILCPQTGIPISQDPGCVTPNHMGSAQQAQQPPPPPQPTGYWEKTWGAIAPSPVDGILGTSVGESTEEEAKRVALSDCQAKGGAECNINLAYHNQCAVMIAGEKFINSFGNATIAEAEQRGLEHCRQRDSKCRVYYSACTEPIFHKF